MKIPVLRKYFIIALLVLLTLIAALRMMENFRTAELKVVVLDVGQGDAIHIETPGGKQVLIDAGRWSPLGNSGESVLRPYFESKGINRLHAVILTHPHSDHIGGIPVLLESMDIDTIYDSGFEHTSALFHSFRRKAAEMDVPVEIVGKGDLLNVDPSVRFFVTGPGGQINNSNPNDHSVVIKLVYNRTHFLFTGDAQKQQEKRLVSRYGDFLKSDFLKMGHHGSRTSSNSHFLNKVEPSKVAGSLSFRNRFNHPHPEAVARVREFTDRIWFTSLEGGMTFRSDGREVRRMK